MTRPLRRAERGAALIIAIVLVLVLAVVATAVIRYAATDRIAAARMVAQDRGLSCAEAGLQYARRYFGCSYKRTGGWADILNGTAIGRFDPSLGDLPPADVTSIPLALRGDGNGDNTLEPGTDLDGDGTPDFWVSLRDDDDERPNNAPDDRQRDNNLTVVIRSECTNRYFSTEAGNVRTAAVVESVLTYVPGHSDYGTAPSSSNAPEASTSGNWVTVNLGNCD